MLKKKSDCSILDKFFRKNQPVILEVHLNASQVQNPEKYGNSYEIASKQWVPFAEVVRMVPVRLGYLGRAASAGLIDRRSEIQP